MKLTREFWEPKKFDQLIERPDIGAKVFYPTNYDLKRPKILAMGFSGKRAKPDFHINFETDERRTIYVENYFKGLEAGIAQKMAWKIDKKHQAKQFLESLKPGVVLYDTWGYEQTNVEFYVVVSRFGAVVTLREMGHLTVEGSEGHDCCKVLPGEAFGPMVKKTVRAGSVKMSSCIRLSLWDGGPIYKSWYY